MPSPFPGMDPYIEQPYLWRDFHSELASQVRAQLNTLLPSNYVARLEPRIEIGVLGLENPQAFLPDVAIAEGPQIPTTPAGAAIAPAPFLTQNLVEEEMRVTAVHITAVPEERLVTVIKILSPINKRKGNAAFDAYLHKRRALLNANVHLLEIDLLRTGERIEVKDPPPPAPYYILLSRAHRRRPCEVWPVRLSEPLPVVPAPLLGSDPDAPLDMQRAVAESYARGSYDRSIDYTQPPPGPLTGAEAAWVKQLLELEK